MAERRMFAKSVIDSDAFLELPAKCQLLYFHLAMRADDDGFVNKAKSILRMVRAKESEFRRLVEDGFLITFDSGAVVIRHWRVHNAIQKDRYRKTDCREELAQLELDESKVYKLLDTPCIQSVSQMDTQDRLGKDRIGKDRIGKDSSGKESTGGCAVSEAAPMVRPPTVTEVMIYVKQKKYQVDPERFVAFYNKNGWRDKGKPMTDWTKAVDLWQQCKW